MKNFKLITIFLVVLLMNCKKETLETGYYMKAKIDNENFEAVKEKVEAYYYTDDGDFMVITGITANKRRISMLVNLQGYQNGTGTYTGPQVIFSFSTEDADSFTDALWDTQTPGSGTGSLTITEENNTEIKGTFKFYPFSAFGDLKNYNTSISITEGKFNAKKK